MIWPKLLHSLHRMLHFYRITHHITCNDQYRSLQAVKNIDVKYMQVVIVNKANLIDGIRINGFSPDVNNILKINCSLCVHKPKYKPY